MKRIIYSLIAVLLVFTGSMQAQTKAIPEDPKVPHFLTLQVEGEGTFTGTATIDGIEEIQISSNKPTDLPDGTVVNWTATPNDGYILARLTKSDGQDETDLYTGDGTTESNHTSTFTIRENVILKAYFVEKGKCSIRYNLTNLTIKEGETSSIEAGEKLELTLVAGENCLLPAEVNVEFGTTPAVVGTDYTYDPETGKLVIKEVKSNVTITAEAIQISATKKWDSFTGRYFAVGKEGSADFGIQTTPKDAEFLFCYVIEDYENWKDYLEIEYANNFKMTESKDFDFSNGKVRISSEECAFMADAYNTYFSFTSSKAGTMYFDVEVYDPEGKTLYATLEDNKISFATPVTLTGSEITGNTFKDISFTVTLENLDEQLKGENGKLFFEIANVSSDDIVLKQGETEIQFQEKGNILYGSTDIVLGDQEYEFSLNSEVPLGETNTISLSVSDDTYSLPLAEESVIKPNITAIPFTTDELTGIQITELPPVILGESLTVTLKANAGYRLPNAITVKMGGQTLVEDDDYTYNAKTGVLYIKEITGSIEIIAKAVEDDEPTPDPDDPDDPTPGPDVPTATTDISGDVVKVWATNGVLHIHTPQPTTIRIVSFSGALIRMMDVPSGDTQYMLPDNLYIVTVGDEVKKIRVR